jgi:signal transduction histidine kinase
LRHRRATVRGADNKIFGRGSDLRSSARLIRGKSSQTQVGDRIGPRTDAIGFAAGYGARMRLWRFVTLHAFDAAVIGLTLAIQIEIWTGSLVGPKLALVPGMLLGTVPLLMRRRFPLAAPVCAFAALAGLTFADPQATTSTDLTVAALMFAFWSVGANTEGRKAVLGLVAGLASIFVIIERDPNLGHGEQIVLYVLGVGAWVAALDLQRRTRRATALEDETARLERERVERERTAVAEERRRIARDLHDVIAHSVSVMTVQAGAARLLLDEEPARAREPLLSVEETGRQALAEMRRLLGIMRRNDSDPALAPQPGLARLDHLLAQAGRAGLPVELTVEGEPKALAAGVDLAAYRIVQEALTNARRHGRSTRAQVAVRYGRETLELEIENDGRIASSREGGHGLLGMRERVELYGGELDTGPRPRGGYAVHVRLPVGRKP